MKNKLFGCLAATVLGAAVVLPTSAMAFRGGGFGGGGMHGGFGGGGFGGGMHGGFGGGGAHGGGGFAGGGFRGGMVTGRRAFVPGVGGFRGGIVTGRSAFGRCARGGYSVMIRSAHSTSDMKIVGLPNLAPHWVRSASVTPRAREQAPQA